MNICIFANKRRMIHLSGNAEMRLKFEIISKCHKLVEPLSPMSFFLHATGMVNINNNNFFIANNIVFILNNIVGMKRRS